MDCPPLFNAWLHSGAGHMQLLEQARCGPSVSSSQKSYEMLLMEREAILGLRDFVDSATPRDVTDEIVMATLALALHPPERKRVPASRMKQTPLSNLQLLSRFTDIVISGGHVHGLRLLVEARGGFDTLEMPGLKQGLSSFNLIVASKHLARPFWPLRTHLQSDEVTDFLANIECPCSPFKEPSHPYLTSALPNLMSWEFEAVRGYTTLLDRYSQGLLPQLEMGYVLELRNMIHHHVMSLPTVDELLTSHQDLPSTYGSLRLGLIAYSLLILFPVPLTTDPHPRLADLLRYELELTQMKLDIWMPMVELLLWVLVLGGVAAVGTVHRPWYVDQIQWLSVVIGIESWEQLKDTMASILWLDSACDIEGLILWEEVQDCVLELYFESEC
ncbi:hypothetical protein BDW59DRAFT_181675 [Aspergillus cavernicola]|uniref:Fungal-specific transcription factor domain-containing protein n=1 Tax=Aspergillus cavernicola TaxID=176166 RepID=A0ABR4HUT9_9EURO